MKIEILPSYHEVSLRGEEIIEEVVQKNPKSILGLATGSSPLGIYQQLIKRCREGHISFRQVTTLNLDEYLGLSKEHPQSYHHFMMEHLFHEMDIPKENCHLPSGTGNPQESCSAYDLLLEQYPRDFQLLGLGQNGHIAFNEPEDFFSRHTRVVDLTQSTLEANSRFFTHEEIMPRQAITMGIKQIFSAKKILIVATGSAKAQAVKQMVDGAITPFCPASILQLHPDTTLLLDQQSAQYL